MLIPVKLAHFEEARIFTPNRAGSRKNEDVNERQADILKEFIMDTKRTITVKEVENRYDVARQTARTDLLGLVEIGYLIEKYVGKKLVFFPSHIFEQKLNELRG